MADHDELDQTPSAAAAAADDLDPAPLPEALAALVAVAVTRAVDGMLGADAIEEMVEQGGWRALRPTDPETAPRVLAAVAAAGLRIAEEELDETDVDALVEGIDLSLDEAESLDSAALWRQLSGRSHVLTRAEESAFAHRLVTYRKGANALGSSESRIANLLDAARAEAARTAEIAALLADDPDMADLAAGPRAEAEAAAAAAAALGADLARARREREALLAAIRGLEETFASYNLRLVNRLASRKFQQARGQVSKMDLIGAGNEGLTIAIKKFDPSLGYKFSTLATFYINQKISEFSLEQRGAGPRIPTHRQRQIADINRFRTAWGEDGARRGEPSAEEIGAATGMRVRTVETALRAATMLHADSLNAPITEDEDGLTRGDVLPDTATLTPEESAIAGEVARIVRERRKEILDPRERLIIELRQGFEDGRTWTLEETGRRLGVTRERVRQIEEKAHKKLAADPVLRELAGRRPLEEAAPEPVAVPLRRAA